MKNNHNYTSEIGPLKEKPDLTCNMFPTDSWLDLDLLKNDIKSLLKIGKVINISVENISIFTFGACSWSMLKSLL